MTIEFQEPSQLTDIRKYAFEKARTDVLKLPESLETIGIAELMDLRGLNATSSFTIPGNVKRIGRLAFTSFDTSVPSIKGTLTILSPYLKKPNPDSNLFILVASHSSSNFTTIKLHQTVYDSYTKSELNAIFRRFRHQPYFDIQGLKRH